MPPGARLLTHDEWFTHVALQYPAATVFFCPYVDYVVYADDFPNGYFQSEIKPAQVLQFDLDLRTSHHPVRILAPRRHWFQFWKLIRKGHVSA